MADPKYVPPRREPIVDWSGREEVPVLTDIVEPEDLSAEPYVALEDEADALPAMHAAEISFDDNFGLEEAEAAGLTAFLDPTVPPAVSPDRRRDDRSARLETLRADLVAELEMAATRIVEEAVAGAEALLIDRVSERLKEEIGGIVGAALADFDRRRKGAD